MLTYQIISSEGATVASTVPYLLPVVAIILGVIVLNESITALIVPGILLILVGQWCHARVSCTSRSACIAVGNYGNTACGHPGTWAIAHTHRAEKGDQYAVRHDGFAFFAAVTAGQAFWPVPPASSSGTVQATTDEITSEVQEALSG